jgi:hypothetical protein
MTRRVHSITEGVEMWKDTAWSWAFIAIVVLGFALGG